MKKLFMFLAVAGLAAFGTSCSSDDNKGGGDGGKDPQLVAKADPSNAKVGQEVKFSATADGKAVDGVDFYAGDTKLNNPHKFTEAKEYKVVAKKKGFVDSTTITVKVTEENGGDPDPDPEPKGELVLSLVTAPADVVANERFEMKLVDETGSLVSGAELYLNGSATGIMSEEGSYGVTPNIPGDYFLKAVKDGITSNELHVVVGEGEPAPDPVGTGTVTYDGQSEAIKGEVFGLGNVFDAGGKTFALWISQSITESWLVQHSFLTEVTLDAEGKIASGLPSGSNVIEDYMGIFTPGGNPIDAIEYSEQEGPADSAELSISYNVKGEGSSGAYFDVEVASSATFKTGKKAKVSYNGDARFVTFNSNSAKSSFNMGEIKTTSAKVNLNPSFRLF